MVHQIPIETKVGTPTTSGKLVNSPKVSGDSDSPTKLAPSSSSTGGGTPPTANSHPVLPGGETPNPNQGLPLVIVSSTSTSTPIFTTTTSCSPMGMAHSSRPFNIQKSTASMPPSSPQLIPPQQTKVTKAGNVFLQKESPFTSLKHSELSNKCFVADQQIRVLTPSEIMRTLPALSQESCGFSSSLVRYCELTRVSIVHLLLFFISILFYSVHKLLPTTRSLVLRGTLELACLEEVET